MKKIREQLMVLQEKLDQYSKQKDEYEKLKKSFKEEFVIAYPNLKSYLDENYESYADIDSDDEFLLNVAERFYHINDIIDEVAKSALSDVDETELTNEEKVNCIKKLYEEIYYTDDITEEEKLEVTNIVMLHLALEESGYSKLKEKEFELLKIKRDILMSRKDISQNMTKKATSTVEKIVDTTKNIVSPYVEVASSQLETAKEIVKDKTRSSVNNGSKKLIKVLNKVIEKTESE